MRDFLTKSAVGAAVAVAFSIGASSAIAGTVSIGLQEDLSGITFKTSAPDSVSWAGSFMDFSNIQASGTDSGILSLPSFFNSNSLDVTKTATGAHTLRVYVTSQDNFSPVGPFLGWTSTFTSQSLTPGWKLTENTYIDTSNALWGTGTPLSSATFTGLDTSVGFANAYVEAGPYSVTEVYTISSINAGNASGSINLAIPEPETYAMMLAGLGLMGFIARRRKKNAAA